MKNESLPWFPLPFINYFDTREIIGSVEIKQGHSPIGISYFVFTCTFWELNFVLRQGLVHSSATDSNSISTHFLSSLVYWVLNSPRRFFLQDDATLVLIFRMSSLYSCTSIMVVIIIVVNREAIGRICWSFWSCDIRVSEHGKLLSWWLPLGLLHLHFQRFSYAAVYVPWYFLSECFLHGREGVDEGRSMTSSHSSLLGSVAFDTLRAGAAQ